MSTFAIVGSETLLGRELREVLGEAKPAPRLQLISAGVEGASVLGADEEEPVVMVALTSESLEGSVVTFLAGSAASSRRAVKLDARAPNAVASQLGDVTLIRTQVALTPAR